MGLLTLLDQPDPNTIGLSTIGGASRALAANEKRGTLATLGAQTAEPKRMIVYLDGQGGGAGTQFVRAAIYENANGVPGQLRAVSSEIAIAAGSAGTWYVFEFADAVLWPNVSYWLVIHGSSNGNVVRYFYNAGGSSAWTTADTYTDGTAERFGAATAAAETISALAGYGLLDWTQERCPHLRAEIGFDSDPTVPLANVVWTDVTPRFLAYGSRRGRSGALQQTEAGRGRLLLDSPDRYLEPGYSGSPYYPNVVPMRRVRVRALWEDVVYPRFTAYAEDFLIDWKGRSTIVEVPLVDASAVLSEKDISGFRAAEVAQPRIAWVLDQAGFPAGDRVYVGAGVSLIQESSAVAGTLLDNDPAYAHIQDVADAELGIAFIARDGKHTFRDRRQRISGFATSLATFSDAPGVGEYLYVGLTPAAPAQRLYSEVRVRPIGGVTDAVAASTPVGDRYTPRTLTRQDIWLATLPEAEAQAQYLLSTHDEPALEFDQMRLQPLRQRSLWVQALLRELDDRVTVRRSPPPGGAAIVRDVHIEAIDESIEINGPRVRWELGWTLSPANPVLTFWILGDANLSLLGQTTLLGY